MERKVNAGECWSMINKAGAYKMFDREKKIKVKKGWMVVAVGVGDGDAGGDNGGDGWRFTIPIHYLRHPLFLGLLDAARDAYDYCSTGPLRLPCSLDEFLHIRQAIERETPQRCAGGRSQLRLSLHSCR